MVAKLDIVWYQSISENLIPMIQREENSNRDVRGAKADLLCLRKCILYG